MASNPQVPLTFINRGHKQIENPISTMTLEEFRKAVDEMKKIRDGINQPAELVYRDKVFDDEKEDKFLANPDHKQYDNMIHGTLKATIEQRRKDLRRRK